MVRYEAIDVDLSRIAVVGWLDLGVKIAVCHCHRSALAVAAAFLHRHWHI